MNSGNKPFPVHFLHRLQLTAGLLLGAAGASPAATTEWVYHKTADGRHPDGNEQQLVWLMNRARSNPAAEGIFLTTSGDEDIDFGLTVFRVNTNLLKVEFAAIAPKPPAAFDRRLYEASRVHSNDLIARNTQDHNNQISRITAAGFSFNTTWVSVFSYANSALSAHGTLNVDWGVPDFSGDTDGMQAGRGHRAAIMSVHSSLLSNVGFAMVPETNPNTSIGPLVFSGAYCNANNTAPNHHNRFITGTVWKDTNQNTRYDPGEGLNDVRIEPDRGSFYAVTGVGGGWAIPVTSPDIYTLTLSGRALGGDLTRSVVVGTESVLVDVKVTPPIPSMTISMNVQNNGNLQLSWAGGRAPYQIQQTTNPSAGWTNWGAVTSNTSASVPRSGPKLFYRVVSSP